MKARVLVVEDEADIRGLVALHLKREGHEVVVAEDGEKALALLSASEGGAGSFQLAVLDWMLPGLSGLDLCREFAGQLPVLMVTARAGTDDIVRGLEAGADDYVTKPFEIAVFLARVRALLRRSGEKKERATAMDQAASLQVGGIRLDSGVHGAWCHEEALKLTLSEYRLLAALLSQSGRVLSRNRLMALVQGEDVTVTARTIDTHVFGLRKKLGRCAALIETIRGVGYRVHSQAEP